MYKWLTNTSTGLIQSRFGSYHYGIRLILKDDESISENIRISNPIKVGGDKNKLHTEEELPEIDYWNTDEFCVPVGIYGEV